MTDYEYKLLPAPTRGVKAPGIKTPEARFANAVETEINALAAEGWEYLRSDTLPHEERQGLTGTATRFRSLLVFRRALDRSDDHVTPVDDDAARQPDFPLPSVLTGTRDTAASRQAEEAPARHDARDQASDEVAVTPDEVAATLDATASRTNRD